MRLVNYLYENCYVCHYVFYRYEYEYDKPVYYKSGYRKGEFKEIQKQKQTQIHGDHGPFVHLYYEKEVDRLMFVKPNADPDEESSLYEDYAEARFKACPNCGSVYLRNLI